MNRKLVVTAIALIFAVPAGVLGWTRLQAEMPASPPGAASPEGTRIVDEGENSGDPSVDGPLDAVRPISWAQATADDGRAVRYLSGIVRAGERAPLAFETSGRVERVAVQVGDAFAAGDMLASLDATALELELDEREAALAEAEATRSDGRRDLERKRSLFRDGVAAEAPYLTARAQLETLDSRVAVARASIARAEERLTGATLVAPYAGTVAERFLEPATFVQAGSPVIEVLGDAGGHEIEVRVPDSLIDRLDADGRYTVRVGRSPVRELDATILEIGTRAMSGAAFPVTLRLEGGDEPMRAGLVAEVRFALRGGIDAAPDALRVPATALVSSAGDDATVFVHDAESATVSARAVRLEGLEGDEALVSGDLAEGDVVASRGAAFLRDGQRVTLLGVGIARFDL